MYYYLSLFPMEAFIASMLDPEAFGTYMAVGSKRGSSDKIIFAEVEGEFGRDFEWEHAKARCVPHENGEPKHSVYLGVYRALERIPIERLGPLYLTTRDGRSLKLDPVANPVLDESAKYYVYQELCPVTPLVASTLNPREFTDFITSPTTKIRVPRIVFAELKHFRLDEEQHTGNLGALYDKNREHLKECVRIVLEEPGKKVKVMDRSHSESFSYQIIGNGIWVGEPGNLLMYPMPTKDELKESHYVWARSAEIIS